MHIPLEIFLKFVAHLIILFVVNEIIYSFESGVVLDIAKDKWSQDSHFTNNVFYQK